MNINKHQNKFGTQAENYTKYRRPYPTELYDLIFEKVTKDRKVLDIACGNGRSTESLAEHYEYVTGCDHDELMIKEAKKQAQEKNLDIKYLVAEASNLPFEDNVFDLLTVGTAFHWFANTETLTEIKRVLKPGGFLFIFWALTTEDIPEQDSIPGDIFAKYEWEKVPEELRDLEHISNHLKENDLEEVSTVRIPTTYQATVDERVGLLKTASSFELLSPKEKNSFIADVTDVLTEKLGDRGTFTLKEEVQVCYGKNN